MPESAKNKTLWETQMTDEITELGKKNQLLRYKQASKVIKENAGKTSEGEHYITKNMEYVKSTKAQMCLAYLDTSQLGMTLGWEDP